jgi:osmotically-inducible protein OsmY
MSDERGPDPQEMSAEDRALAVRIDRALRDEAEIFAAVRVKDGVAYLDGMIESAAQRDAATDLALAVDGITRVQNDLEIEEFGLPGEATQPDEQIRGDVSYRMLEADREANPTLLQEQTEPDYNEPIATIGDDVTSDPMIAVEEGIPYVPPTDPVVRPSRDEQTIEIVGGFGTSSDDEFPDLDATTALGDAPPGDEDLREEVLAALRADAATTELIIDVTVRNGTVRLRGEVQTLDDAELAEEVAGRVPGIREVIEELTVPSLG